MSVRYITSGNKTKAEQLLGVGRHQLSILRRMMAFQELEQLKRTTTFPDGAVITCSIVYGQANVHVYSPVHLEAEWKEIKEVKGVPYPGWIEDWENVIRETWLTKTSEFRGRYYIETKKSPKKGHVGDIIIDDFGILRTLLYGQVDLFADTKSHVPRCQTRKALKIELSLPASICQSDHCEECSTMGGIVNGWFGAGCWDKDNKIAQYRDNIYVQPPKPISMGRIKNISYEFCLEDLYPMDNDLPDAPNTTPIVSDIHCSNGKDITTCRGKYGSEDEDDDEYWCARPLFYGHRIYARLWWQRIETGDYDYRDQFLIGEIYGKYTARTWNWNPLPDTNPTVGPPSTYTSWIDKRKVFSWRNFGVPEGSSIIPYGSSAYNFCGVTFYAAVTLQWNPYPENWPGIYIKASVDNIRASYI